MPDQVVSSLTYDRVTTTTTATTLPTAIEQSGLANVSTDVFYLTLQSTAVAQVSTFTISGTLTSTDIVTATIAVTGGYSFKYSYEANASDTIETVGTRLATLIDTDPNVTASAAFAASTSTITVTSAVPGQAFTLTSGKTGTVTVGAAATGTANAGTAMRRKIAEATWTFDDSADGFITAKGQVKFYNGGSSPTLVSTQDTATYKHAQSIDAIRTAQGAS
jgi:phage tail sheath gpL-like